MFFTALVTEFPFLPILTNNPLMVLGSTAGLCWHLHTPQGAAAGTPCSSEEQQQWGYLGDGHEGALCHIQTLQPKGIISYASLKVYFKNRDSSLFGIT